VDSEVIFLTPEGHEKLTAELKHLVQVRRAEVAELISDAKEAGDVRENSAYDEAKEQQAFVEGRIRQIEDILSRSQLIQENGSTDEVVVGCQVTVAENGLEPEEFRIVGSAEADPTKGTISNQSPLGRALLGKRKGDAATIVTPGGEELTFTILSID
jgi:transcription elongation factor GreA